MKKFIHIIILGYICAFHQLGFAQYFVNFEDATKTSYNSGNVTLNGIQWNLDQALIGSDANDLKFDNKSARIRFDGTTYGTLTMLQDKPDGIGTISFYYARSNFSGDRTGNAPVFVVEYSTNGGNTWTQAGPTTSLSGVDNLTLFSVSVNVADNARIRIRQVGGDSGKRWNVDNITITDYTACSTPTIQAHSITFSNVQTSQLTVSWNNGDGSGRLVKINTSNTFTDPVNGTTYPANSTYNGSGEQVVYVGNASSVTVTNLTPNVTYWFRIYEFNCSGSSIVYNTTTATNNPASQTTEAALPIITVSTSTLWGMNYTVGTGPSASQSYVVQGQWLTPASGIIDITAPTNYEISTDNSIFSTSLSLSYTGGTLNPTTVYVRLKAGLPQGTYNGELIQHQGGGSANIYVSCSGTVFGTSSSPTILEPGDIVVIGLNSNIACLPGYSSGDDELSFFAFKDIHPGTKFYITDNGYERSFAGKWGDTEGLYEIERTVSSIPAGTVITFRLKDAAPFVEFIQPDANWTMTKVPSFTGNLIMNSNGDQIFFMQGGTWNNPPGNQDAEYVNGTFLFAFNTNNSWTPFGNSTQHSALPPGMECFQLMPNVATDFLKYTGPITPTTKRDWIDRINDISNWTSIPGGNTTEKCQNYYSTSPLYHNGYFMNITSGGFTAGIWTGEVDSDWFNCANWQDFRVPNEQVNVFIPSTGVTNDPVIGNPPTNPVPYSTALCNNLIIANNRTVTLNHSNSKLTVYGNMQIEGLLNHLDGWIEIVNNNSTIAATQPVQFYQLRLNKNLPDHILTLTQHINIQQTLSLNRGIINTQNYRVNILNPSPAAITGYSLESYIAGNLRRAVNSPGIYDFPIGTSSHPELATITLNSSSGLDYIDATFTSPHSTSIDISPLNLLVNGTLLEELLNYGFWTFTPSGGSYNYDIALTSRGHTNPGPTADAHAVIKRQNASSSWVSEGIHNNSDQSMGSDWVRAVRKNLTSFSDFAIAKSNSGPLPVQLLSFAGTREHGNAIIIWTTASEFNNDYFILERAIDSEQFIPIATIKGAGNSNSMLNYQYIDYHIPETTVYYRLRQIDYDGKQTLYGPIALKLQNYSDNTPVLLQQHFQDGIGICVLTNVQPGLLTIETYDLTGRKTYHNTMNIEQTPITIRIPFHSAGVFYVRISNQQQHMVIPFVIPSR